MYANYRAGTYMRRSQFHCTVADRIALHAWAVYRRLGELSDFGHFLVIGMRAKFGDRLAVAGVLRTSVLRRWSYTPSADGRR